MQILSFLSFLSLLSFLFLYTLQSTHAVDQEQHEQEIHVDGSSTTPTTPTTPIPIKLPPRTSSEPGLESSPPLPKVRVLTSLEQIGGLEQTVPKVDGETKAVQQVLEETRKHMIKLELSSPTLRAECVNKHELCSFWASSIVGECEKNKAYMHTNCAPACQSCDLMLFENRCPKSSYPRDSPAFVPGGLDSMFRNITAEGGVWEGRGVEVLSEDPWIVTIDRFVSGEEADR